jgi:DNA-binding response OmpR family regulator
MEKNILLVEDEIYIRDLYHLILTKAGYVVEPAEDGEIAIVKARERTYDLILLDIMLPKVTGVDVMKEIRSKEDCKSQCTPVIVISNMGEDVVVQNMLKLGAEKYLFKSRTSNEELVREINAFFQEKNET